MPTKNSRTMIFKYLVFINFMKRKRVAGNACRACVPKACLVCILYLVYKNTFDFSWQSSVSIAKQDFNGGYFGSCFLLGGLSTKQHMNKHYWLVVYIKTWFPSDLLLLSKKSQMMQPVKRC